MSGSKWVRLDADLIADLDELCWDAADRRGYRRVLIEEAIRESLLAPTGGGLTLSPIDVELKNVYRGPDLNP